MTTKKKIIPITIGEIIPPKNKPNLNQSILRGVKILEFKMPKIKKRIEINIDQSHLLGLGKYLQLKIKLFFFFFSLNRYMAEKPKTTKKKVAN